LQNSLRFIGSEYVIKMIIKRAKPDCLEVGLKSVNEAGAFTDFTIVKYALIVITFRIK